MLFRIVLLFAVVFAFADEADAQRFYRRRARMMTPPGVGVAVTPGGGVSVRTPFYSFDRAPGVTPGYYYGGRFGWPGVSVRVQQGAIAPSPETRPQVGPTPTPAGDGYDPAPADEFYSPPPTAGFNLAPNFEPTSATRAGLEGELAMAHAGLNDRLDQFNGGEGWKKYFALSQDELADPAKTERLLRRMDSVARDRQFEAVARLDEFQRMHKLLKVIAAADSGQAPPAEEPVFDRPINEQRAAEPNEQRAAEPYEAIPVPRETSSQGPPPEPQPPAESQQPGDERSVLRQE